MGKAAERPPYERLAQYYDVLFTEHRAWMEAARATILGRILDRAECACDLACGTGTTAIALARRGIRMYGVDGSQAMCRIAREKVRRAGLSVRIIHADMRDFRLPEPVDVITCEGDAVNHVPQKDDLAGVANSAARALRPGGYLFLDVNNSPAFRNVWPLAFWTEKPSLAVAMHGGYDAARDSAWSDVEMFVRRGRDWRRLHEHIEEVCWTSLEMRETLARAGFDEVRAWDAAPFLQIPAFRRGYRTFYRARRLRA